MQKIGKLCGIIFALLCLWAVPMTTSAHAQGWQDYELPHITFSTPQDWEITYSQRDVEYDFASPDGTFSLWVNWWFPDEPLLGYDDIVSHRTLTLAGKTALLIHIETETERYLTIAFPEDKNSDGEVLLFQLIAPMSLTITNHEKMMDMLTGRFFFDGQKVQPKSRTPFSSGEKSSATAPKATPAPPSPKQDAPPHQTTSAPVTHYYDADTDFSVPHPVGWETHTAQGNGLSQVALVAPEQDAMVLVIAARGQDARSATDMALGLLYRDSLIIKSIEDEAYPEIGQSSAHAVETVSKIYSISNIAMPYTRGRVWVYQGGDTENAYVIVTIRPTDATQDRQDQLAAIATGFRFGAPPSSATSPATSPVLSPKIKLPSKSSKESLGEQWLAQLETHFQSECILETLVGSSRSALTVMKTANAEPRFLATCMNGAHPIFAADFPYDPQGQTSDYFYPLYIETFQANDNSDFSFLAIQDQLLLTLTLEDDNSLSLEVTELSAPEPLPSPKDATSSPDDMRAVLGPVQIFDGHSLADWEPFAFEGGDFDLHTNLGHGGMHISIPDDKGWAKTGLIYRGRAFELPENGEKTSLEISVLMDADASNSLTIAMLNPEKDTTDPYESYLLRFHLVKSGDLGVLSASAKNISQTARFSFLWPENDTTVRFILRSDDVFELRDAESNVLALWDIGKPMSKGPWSLAVYGQVPRKNTGFDLVIKDITATIAPTPDTPDPDKVGARNVALFDGRQVSPNWVPLQNAENLFRSRAYLQGGTLKIGWPQDDTGAKYLGIYTPEPVIWLDTFHEGAETRLTVTIDGAITNDFEVGLQQAFGLYHNMLSNGAWVASWRRQDDGTFTFRTEVRGHDGALIAEGLSQVPNQFDIVLTPKGVAIDGVGLPSGVVPWTQLIDGAGLRIWTYAMASKQGNASLALHGIDLKHTPAPAMPPAAPAAGVAPLAQTVLFDGTLDASWQKISRGNAIFQDLARITDAGLVLARRENPPNNNKIALASTEKIITLDERVQRTPYRLDIQLDPSEQNLGGWIYLTENPDNPYDTASVAIELERLTYGPNNGGLRVRMYSGHMYYSHLERTFQADWLATWDGMLSLVLGDGAAGLKFGDTLTHAITTSRVQRGGAYRLMFEPGQRTRPSEQALTLAKVTGGWITPANMTAQDRWLLVDDETFDADAFADELAIGIMGN